MLVAPLRTLLMLVFVLYISCVSTCLCKIIMHNASTDIRVWLMMKSRCEANKWDGRKSIKSMRGLNSVAAGSECEKLFEKMKKFYAYTSGCLQNFCLLCYYLMNNFDFRGASQCTYPRITPRAKLRPLASADFSTLAFLNETIIVLGYNYLH